MITSKQSFEVISTYIYFAGVFREQFLHLQK